MLFEKTNKDADAGIKARNEDNSPNFREIDKDESCGVCGATGLRWVRVWYFGHRTYKMWCPGMEFEEHDAIWQKQRLLNSGLPASVCEELIIEIAELRARIHNRIESKKGTSGLTLSHIDPDSGHKGE